MPSTLAIIVLGIIGVAFGVAGYCRGGRHRDPRAMMILIITAGLGLGSVAVTIAL